MNLNKNNNRCSYVDIAKGMVILSVVLLHVDFVYPDLPLLNVSGMLGWYWHVPVFFYDRRVLYKG